MDVVIIGNGIAGVTVAQELSARTPDAHITVIGAERHPFYSRIRLPEVVAGHIEPTATTMYPPQWYGQRNIIVRVSTRVTRIDRKNRRVELSAGTTIPYDALVLATGSNPNTLQIPGAALDGIHVLRTLDDALSLRQDLLAHSEEPVAIIGGGLLGLEAAVGARACVSGSVCVLEYAPYRLSRQLDRPASELLAGHLGTLGVDIVVSAATVEFTDGGDGRVGTIKLADGRAVDARTVLQSLGVTPEVSLARDCGLTVDRGIVVDAHLKTSDPAIYAVGDCAEFEKRCWGIVPAALEQGQVAAKVIAGEDAEYAGTVPSTMLKIAGIETASLGKIALSDEEKASGRWTTESRCVGNRYESFLLQDSILRGAILFGSKAHIGQVRKLVGRPMDAKTLSQLLGF
jgi:NAD(P)H-nitrite reductase large subunit